MMGDVYSHTQRVLAYLSEYFESCELAIEAIYQLGLDSNTYMFSEMKSEIEVERVGFESP